MDKADKDLLLEAAKAGGLAVVTPTMLTQGKWNPLENRAQALELLVECNLTLCADGYGTVSVSEAWKRDGVFITQSVNECESKLHAACRAITRAAAEIGKYCNADN